ncbi:hypothetical protein KTO58_07460 [Chitinophaga pendula]|uniref:hypothetical protein n=1 Tax=Chitinophaga TaxID=79328 RepID=UPI000BB00541|nr:MULTISPECIES: hypothetical protein [Chitinophaga]ASZ13369.1 hypothetical protein CK934_21575 [Chitinophaga sp. MD30]UCJ09010.1 hypothetical protein KTO58_07460 [Chitinophaga pendula]
MLLFSLQLVVGFIPGWSTDRLVASDRHLAAFGAPPNMCLEDWLSQIPYHLESDANDEPEEVIQVKKNRRKPRYYISASSQQFSFTQRVFQDTGSPSQRIHIQENKTGEYQQQDVFLPAYYSFLFRFTPF